MRFGFMAETRTAQLLCACTKASITTPTFVLRPAMKA